VEVEVFRDLGPIDVLIRDGLLKHFIPFGIMTFGRPRGLSQLPTLDSYLLLGPNISSKRGRSSNRSAECSQGRLEIRPAFP
jgi:hypothetical protein